MEQKKSGQGIANDEFFSKKVTERVESEKEFEEDAVRWRSICDAQEARGMM